MKKFAALMIAATFMFSACTQQDRGVVEVEPVGERQAADQATDRSMQQQQGEAGSEGTSLRDVQEEAREAWQTSRNYASRLSAEFRDDVENKMNEASDNLQQLRREARTGETARELERELQSVRQDFNRLSREAQQSAGETATTLQQEWQELEDRVDELSVEIRTELRTRERTNQGTDSQTGAGNAN